MTGISLVTLFLTQTDKIILSKMLSLEHFAYYTLAWTVCALILQLIAPIDAAVYPTFARLVAVRDDTRLVGMYHAACQFQAVLLISATVTLALFGVTALMLWSRDPVLTANVAPILAVLAVGKCLNGFMHLPYMLQLAHGWTSLAFYTNTVATLALVPLMIVLTDRYRGVGGAIAWVILNGGYVLIAAQIQYRRILPHEKRDWYVRDIGMPTLAALAVAGPGRLLMPVDLPLAGAAAYAAVIGGASFLSATIAAEHPRTKLLGWMQLLRRKAALRIS